MSVVVLVVQKHVLNLFMMLHVKFSLRKLSILLSLKSLNVGVRCDFMNFAKNTVCLQCDAKRPKRQLLPGEWECPE